MSFPAYHAATTERPAWRAARVGGYADRYAPSATVGAEPARRYAIGVGSPHGSGAASFQTTVVGSLVEAQAEAWRLAGGAAEAHVCDVSSGAKWRRAPGGEWSGA